jgi:hypothetical protein
MDSSSKTIAFPEFTGLRCLMMPYVQGEPESVPAEIRTLYEEILSSTFVERGSKGYLTIDESICSAGVPHRGARAKFGRALHTEAGLLKGNYKWGGHVWGGRPNVLLDRGVQVLLASSVGGSCAIWDAVHAETSEDGDLGHVAADYPYATARMLAAGEVCQIGILTPHESLPLLVRTPRQFLRIVSGEVIGREPYFTTNPLMP